MTWFSMIAGTVIYFIIGGAIDAVAPGADLLGFNVQALVLSSACMIGAIWLAVRLQLFD